MPRKVKEVLIAAEGRDKGKTFVIHEMACDQAERWANRLLLALANAGTKLPEGSLANGMAGFSTGIQTALVTGIQAMQGLHYGDISQLLDEMMACVKYRPQPGAPEQDLYPGENCQTEEITTRWRLRFEWIQLHVGFSLAGSTSTSASNSATPPA